VGSVLIALDVLEESLRCLGALLRSLPPPPRSRTKRATAVMQLARLRWLGYGRREMPEWTSDRRRREVARTRASSSLPQRSADPVLELQRSAGNAAVARMLARAPTAKGTTGSVHIGGVGDIQVTGGNLEEWAGKGAPDAVEVASEKGKHSAKLEKLATARTKTDVKVTISPPHKEDEHLNVGGGIVLEINDARIKHYAVEDGTETWQVADFENVKRTKITHTIGAS
jgi:hypothetical protein